MRARFGARAAMLAGRSLDAAIAIVERWWRDERKAFQIASALGYGNRLSLEVLCELRLILRLLRFKRMQAEYEIRRRIVATCRLRPQRNDRTVASEPPDAEYEPA